MFSSWFILQTVLKLVELQPESPLEHQLQDSTCARDMSVSPEVVTLLLEIEAIDTIPNGRL